MSVKPVPTVVYPASGSMITRKRPFPVILYDPSGKPIDLGGSSGPAKPSSGVIDARIYGTSQDLALGNTMQTMRHRHIAAASCSDVRLVFGSPKAKEADNSFPTTLRVGLELNGVIWPVTFYGKDSITIEPGGGFVVSDPVPVELGQGDVFWSRVFVSTPFGVYTTTTAAFSAGVTSITVTDLPGGSALNPQNGYTGKIQLDMNANAEIVTVIGVSGTGPYTLKLASATTKAHASGVALGQVPFSTGYLYGDIGEGFTQGSSVSSADLSRVTTAIPAYSTKPTTTLAAAASIGQTKLVLNAPMFGGETLVVDSETVQVKSITGTGPYNAYLAAPLTANHANGATVTAQIASIPIAHRPVVVTADQILGDAPAVGIAIGDSINYNAWYTRQEKSWFSIAFGEPYLNIALAGEQAAQFVLPQNRKRRSSLLRYGTFGSVDYGTNDIYTLGSSLASLQASVISIWKAASRRLGRLSASTLLPRTTSTDDFTTLANQAIVAGDVTRKAYNAWLRDGAPMVNGVAVAVGTQDATRCAVYDVTGAKVATEFLSHPLTVGVIELADAVESARDSGKWKVDPTGPYTSDGTHPSLVGVTAMVAAVPVSAHKS